ncbi:alpha/beta hydrolase fold [Musa troglodytarum]|uniref:Alpha/beta hydrolase fold n=1 Tax=Musa troglodytarum TaxID=320322 RepID=A0A9E7JV45_9LILI|nr:alpha/beta hydrolase fold [Musa troglodytarum]
MEQLVNFIIRPPRADYSPQDDLLEQEFMLKGRWFQRKDLEVINGRGKKLQCSHYVPLVIPEGKVLPCVIYCHGNRADASEAAIVLLPSNITVFTLDFSGSGLSEGEHVTLGWSEKDDLTAVVDYLRTNGNVSCIGLWGRSMGAVTSLMYGAEDPSIAGMVLDSPFSNLVDLMMELVDTYKYPLPKFTVKLAIQHMRKIIKKKANFDIMDLDTIQVAKRCFVPVLLGHAIDDDFIRPHHSDDIYSSYVGDKNIIKFDGDHNSPRPQFYFDSITIFFHNVLDPPKSLSDELYFHRMHDFFGQVPRDISSQEKQHEDEEHGSTCNVGPSSTLYPEDFSSGDSYGWLTPPTKENFLEFLPLESLPDVPCSIEDEERMIMEAMIESLKDLEMRHQQDTHSTVDSATSKSADDLEAFTGESSGPNDTAERSTSSSTSCNSTVDPHLNQSQDVEAACKNSASCVTLGDDCSEANRSTSAQDADGDGDAAAGTRATLVVQKNPTSHIMEGLSRRWGLNFFKNNQ